MELYSQPYRRRTSRLSISLSQTSDANGGHQLSVETLKDAPGTLLRLCAVLYRRGWNIRSAEICTEENGQILDRFVVVPTGDGVDEIIFETMMQDLERLLFDALSVHEYISEDYLAARPSAESSVDRLSEERPEVRLPQNADEPYLELSGRDRPGLLQAIAHVLAHRDIDVLEAEIQTIGERVANRFLINPTDARLGIMPDQSSAKQTPEQRSFRDHLAASLRELL